MLFRALLSFLRAFLCARFSSLRAFPSGGIISAPLSVTPLSLHLSPSHLPPSHFSPERPAARLPHFFARPNRRFWVAPFPSPAAPFPSPAAPFLPLHRRRVGWRQCGRRGWAIQRGGSCPLDRFTEWLLE